VGGVSYESQFAAHFAQAVSSSSPAGLDRLKRDFLTAFRRQFFSAPFAAFLASVRTLGTRQLVPCHLWIWYYPLDF